MPSDLDKAALDFVAESLDLSPEQVIVSYLIPRPFSSICVAGRGGRGEKGGVLFFTLGPPRPTWYYYTYHRENILR